MRRLCLLLLCAPLFTGCQTSTQRALAFAHTHGLRSSIERGQDFRHQLFEVDTPSRAQLLVLIEGDGTPWEVNGTQVASDPTPRRPLMLRILARTRMSALYVGRPCYFGTLKDAGCAPRLWTSARYSEAVVASLAAVINTHVERGGFERVILAGHSGGGTLAVLLASRVPRAVAVVTLSADLDTSAWTRLHRYLPLDQSLNPGDLPPLPPRISEWHAVGDRDRNVPPAVNARYFERLPRGRVLHFPKADHACCWEKVWPEILARVVVPGKD
jgi:pimeloyl-ACP methyl ester carboxylesterase